MTKLRRNLGKVLFLGVISAAASSMTVASGCGSARRDAPLLANSSHQLSDPKLIRGQQAFNTHCNQCHPGGATGLAPALNNKPAPGWLIKTQVRVGLGAMPAFSKDHIPDEQLDDLVAYVKYLRHEKVRG